MAFAGGLAAALVTGFVAGLGKELLVAKEAFLGALAILLTGVFVIGLARELFL